MVKSEIFTLYDNHFDFHFGIMLGFDVVESRSVTNIYSHDNNDKFN